MTHLGGHPARRAGIDPGAEPGRWWILSVLLDPRGGGEVTGASAWQALQEAGWDRPGDLSAASLPALGALLEKAGLRRVEVLAPLLARGAAALAADPALLDRTRREAEDLESLARALRSRLPGFGPAALARYLRPLRRSWPAAEALPLEPAALTAGRHLGLLSEWEEPGEAAAALASALLRAGDDADPVDVEAALQRLGRRACLRGRPERCPLGRACPARERP